MLLFEVAAPYLIAVPAVSPDRKSIFSMHGGKIVSPMHAKLSYSESPRLWEVVHVELTVESAENAPDTEVGIVVPKGFSVVDGSVSWRGDLMIGSTVAMPLTLRAEKIGNWTLVGYGKSHGHRNQIGSSDFVYFTIGEESSSASKTDPELANPIGNEITLASAKLVTPQGPSAPGTLVVWGYEYFYEEDGSTLRPMKYANVYLYDEDLWRDQHVACDHYH